MALTIAQTEDLRRIASETNDRAIREAWSSNGHPARGRSRSEAGSLLMDAALARLGGQWKVDRFRMQSRRTLCADISNGSREAFIKFRLVSDGDLTLEKEHDALCCAAKAPRDLLVPRPIAFIPELPALVMDRLPDVHLDQALRRRWRSRARIIRKVGEALAVLHQATGRHEKTAAQLWHEQTVPPAVRRACQNRSERRWADKVCDAYLSAAARTRQDTVPFGFVHGDMMPRNIVVDGERIGFLDFENSQQTHCLNDLARAAIGIQKDMRPRPFQRKDRYGFGFSAQVLHGLCEGYGLAPRHEAHFATILLRGCLHEWLHYKSKVALEPTATPRARQLAAMAERIAQAMT